jgi:hypothetical protein
MAQTLDTRPGDALISSVDLDARLRGQELIFFDDGVSHFYNDGRYTYAYDMGAGGYAYGYFEVTDDSTVCIDFVNGFPAATRSWKMADACPDHPRRRPVSHPGGTGRGA